MAARPGESTATLEADQFLLQSRAAEMLGVDLEEIADWHINRIRSDGRIEADISLTQINTSDVPTDPSHVAQLKDDFDEEAKRTKGTGQIDNVVVCHVPGEDFYLVDGFHRYDVQIIREVPILTTTIEPHCTYDDVVRRRLDYASAHPEIKFARQVDWVQKAWERTDWFEKIPNVLTAFRTVADDYSPEARDDYEMIERLNDDEYNSIQEWVREKSKQWKRTPKQIREDLAQVESFSPELMQLIYKQPGVPPEGRIGLKHVSEITKVYPLEFDLQEAAVLIITGHRLTVAQTALLLDRVEEYGPQSVADFNKAVQQTDIEFIKSLSSRSRSNGSTSPRGSAAPTNVDRVETPAVVDAVVKRIEGLSINQAGLTPEAALGAVASIASMLNRSPALDPTMLDGKLLENASVSVSKLAEKLVELSEREPAEDLNRAQHSDWGLEFKSNDGDAPTVILERKKQYGLSDLASSILFVVAGEDPGSTFTDQEIADKLSVLGLNQIVDGEDIVTANETKVRAAIHEAEKLLRKFGKDNHVIMQEAGVRKIRFGLVTGTI